MQGAHATQPERAGRRAHSPQVWHAVLGYLSGFEEQLWEVLDDPTAVDRMKAAVAAYKGACGQHACIEANGMPAVRPVARLLSGQWHACCEANGTPAVRPMADPQPGLPRRLKA